MAVLGWPEYWLAFAASTGKERGLFIFVPIVDRSPITTYALTGPWCRGADAATEQQKKGGGDEHLDRPFGLPATGTKLAIPSIAARRVVAGWSREKSREKEAMRYLGRQRKPAQTRNKDSVEKATTLVKTTTLNENGIDHIRVLSESKFLGLVRTMVQESLRSEVAPADAAPQGAGECQAEWQALRQRHTQNLDKIETGMQRLSQTFSNIRDMLGHLNGGEAPAAAPVPPSPAARQSAPQQTDLLRDMLL